MPPETVHVLLEKCSTSEGPMQPGFRSPLGEVLSEYRGRWLLRDSTGVLCEVFHPVLRWNWSSVAPAILGWLIAGRSLISS